MLIRFAVSNYMSFDNQTELSLLAGKARKYAERLFIDRRLKLVKCEALFGANATGKSNLVDALQFMQNTIEDGFPRGFSNKYYRLKEENRNKPSVFEVEFLCSQKHFCYGFSIVLNKGSILNEWLYERTPSGKAKYLFCRNAEKGTFQVGEYFKSKEAINKLLTYGEDSIEDRENLFLTIINKSKGKMFSALKEMSILNEIYFWFVVRLNISVPEGVLTGYPYFKDSNLDEIAELLNALGTGITSIQNVEVPMEVVKRKIPEGLFNRIITKLEKENAIRKKEGSDQHPSIVARAYKEFYTFEIDDNDTISIRTIEFSHEGKNVYFSLQEESDGTARLLDLIEILFKVSSNNIYVIDEIDRCLHPALTAQVIKLFLEMAAGRNTQLIITTHESRLLKEEILRNDEISFVLKKNDGSTIIKPLEEYNLRADKKVYEALFDGTIDTLPRFDYQKLFSVTTKNS